MMFHAKYLESVGAAMADEVFKQTDNCEPQPEPNHSIRQGLARLMQREAAAQEQREAVNLVGQETIKHCV